VKWEVEWRLGRKEWSEQWSSESEKRDDRLGMRSDHKISATDLPALPDLLLLQSLHEWLCLDVSSFCPLATQGRQSSP
jgi:hypothetical protein